jgi:hypothetical protein
MRLSQWRVAAPGEAVTQKVAAVVDPVIAALGAEIDPHCWVIWGDDPRTRYVILVPTSGGLVQVHVRVNVLGEGPRAAAKLYRWSKLQVGELAIEMHEGHRVVSLLVEQQILQGTDLLADRIVRFVLVLIAGIEGRTWPSFDAPGTRSRGARKARPAVRAADAAAERLRATRPGMTRPGVAKPGSTATGGGATKPTAPARSGLVEIAATAGGRPRTSR